MNMTSLRDVLGEAVPDVGSVRGVLRTEFLQTKSRISVREAIASMRDYDSVVVLVHGVGQAPRPGYGNLESNMKSQWPAELTNTLFVKLFWGQAGDLDYSNSIGERTNQVYGLPGLSWSGTAKLTDAVGRIRHALGGDVPICVVAYSQGCGVTIAALQEGLKIDNLILLGSPLDQKFIDDQSQNTSLDRAAGNVSGKVINCSSWEDGVTMAGGVASLLGGSGTYLPRPLGRHGLPARFLGGNSRFSNLQLDEVDHNDEDGWLQANWLDDSLHRWQGTTPAHFISVLSSTNRPTSMAFVTPRKKAVVDAHLLYLTKDNRHWHTSGDKGRFDDTVFIPPLSMVRWHWDDMDWASYKILVRNGSLELRIDEAVDTSWQRSTGTQTVIADGEPHTRTLDSDGIQDATYRLTIVNPTSVAVEADLIFSGKDD